MPLHKCKHATLITYLGSVVMIFYKLSGKHNNIKEKVKANALN